MNLVIDLSLFRRQCGFHFPDLSFMCLIWALQFRKVNVCWISVSCFSCGIESTSIKGGCVLYQFTHQALNNSDHNYKTFSWLWENICIILPWKCFLMTFVKLFCGNMELVYFHLLIGKLRYKKCFPSILLTEAHH